MIALKRTAVSLFGYFSQLTCLICHCAILLHLKDCFLPTEMIEVTCNDRLGKKVRVKCKYPFEDINRIMESFYSDS